MKIYKCNEKISEEERKKILNIISEKIKGEIRYIIERHNEELNNDQYSYFEFKTEKNSIILIVYNILVPYNSSLVPYLVTDSLKIGGFCCQKYRIPL